MVTDSGFRKRIALGGLGLEIIQRAPHQIEAEKPVEAMLHSELRNAQPHDAVDEVRHDVPAPFAGVQIPLAQPILMPATPAPESLEHILNHTPFHAVPAENQILDGSR